MKLNKKSPPIIKLVSPDAMIEYVALRASLMRIDLLGREIKQLDQSINKLAEIEAFILSLSFEKVNRRELDAVTQNISKEITQICKILNEEHHELTMKLRIICNK